MTLSHDAKPGLSDLAGKLETSPSRVKLLFLPVLRLEAGRCLVSS
jgi:hypothetical protein